MFNADAIGSSASWGTNLTSSSTSISSSSTIVTPTATLASSSSTTNFFSTITSAPLWGDQVIPINTCSVTATNGEIQWTPCALFAGTIQMSFFPENSGNITYPSTLWNSDWGVTMTSPSIYMRVNTITGQNDCGQLGPTFKNAVVSMDLTEVSTLQPYADHTVTTRMGPPQPLLLRDLTSNCLSTYGSFSTDGAFLNTHPVFGNYNRCNPRFVFPIQFKRIGYPYWMHCGPLDYVYGIFDPPGAVPPVSNLLPTTIATPVVSTTIPPTTLPTATADQAPSMLTQTTSPPGLMVSLADTLVLGTSASSLIFTTSAQNLPPPAALSTISTSQETTIVDSSPPTIVPPLTNTSPTDSTPASSTALAESTTAPSAVSPGDNSQLPIQLDKAIVKAFVKSAANCRSTDPPTSQNQPNPSVTMPSEAVPTISTAIRVVGSHIISAIPHSSGVVLSNDPKIKPGSIATSPDSNNQPTTISVGSSGILIGETDKGDYTTCSSPTVTPVPVATVASHVISAAAGASSIVVGSQSQTAVLGGDPITVASSVIKLTPSGIVVNDGSASGKENTFTIPTLASTHNAVPPTAIATIGEDVVSAAPGDTQVSINGQVIAAGGAPVTLAGSNNVATLGTSGLIVQFPGGSVSTFAIHTASSTESPIISTVAGIPISASAGASVISIGSQAITLGGAPVTVSGSNVLSLGSGGLEIQMPGGAVSTISAQPSNVVNAATSMTTIGTSSSRGIAFVIASSMSEASPHGVSCNDRIYFCVKLKTTI
ncbi:hypothetical protein B7463_g7552, partial [Scytalidium lignicola]